MLFGIAVAALYLLIVPVMVALGMTLVLFLWAPRFASSTRLLVACLTGPGLIILPALFAPGTVGTPIWTVAIGVGLFVAVLGAVCFPFVRIAARRLERLHPVNASVFA